MVIIFWFSFTLMIASLTWDIVHWLLAWSYAKKLKRDGVPFWQRLQDKQWQHNWRAAIQDTACSLVVGQICSFLMPYFVGYAFGLFAGLVISVWNRLEEKKDSGRQATPQPA